MSSALATSTRPAMLELYEALKEIDPVRYRSSAAARVRARFAAAADRLERAAAESERGELGQRLARIARMVRDRAPEEGHEDPSARWLELRAALMPEYESLAAALRLEAVHVPSLRPTNHARSLFHVLSALAGLGVVALGPFWMRILAGAFFTSAVLMETGRRVSGGVNDTLMKLFGPVAHPHEAHRINSASWYSLALIVLAFSFRPEVCAAAVAVLGFGDPAAALIGRRFGRIRLVHGRSLEGSIALVVAGTLAAFGALRIYAPEVGVLPALGAAVAAASAGALAELFSHRIDDNLSVPLAAAVGCWLVW